MRFWQLQLLEQVALPQQLPLWMQAAVGHLVHDGASLNRCVKGTYVPSVASHTQHTPANGQLLSW